VDINPERRKVLGERFGVRALYPDVESLLREMVPDIAAVVTPTKYMKEAVMPVPKPG
jgi:predicted dehydrogenase